MGKSSNQAIITFDREISEEGFEEMARILMSIKGVISVDQPSEHPMDHEHAVFDAKAQLRKKFADFYKETFLSEWQK